MKYYIIYTHATGELRFKEYDTPKEAENWLNNIVKHHCKVLHVIHGTKCDVQQRFSIQDISTPPDNDIESLIDKHGNPLQYMYNIFTNVGDKTVLDSTTGLTWQRGGSDEPMVFDKAQEYINQLNGGLFAGFLDWRLPTIQELMTLLKSKEGDNGLYIDSVFDTPQKYCWSSTTHKSSSESAWIVNFDYGHVYWSLLYDLSYVRAVRS